MSSFTAYFEQIKTILKYFLTTVRHIYIIIIICLSCRQDRSTFDPRSKFSSNLVKLLYTLHWVILDAASECEDMEAERCRRPSGSLYSYMHSLDTIQLFVYLFAPLIHTTSESDFQSLKLENGLRLWCPLWQYRLPDVPCFSTPVKVKRVTLKAERNMLRVNFNMANIYIGKGTSTDNVYLGFGDSPDESESNDSSITSKRAPLAHLSDICALSASETTTSVEIICEICNSTIENNSGMLACLCGTRRESSITQPPDGGTSSGVVPPGRNSPVDVDYVQHRIETTVGGGVKGSADVASATYFDVAVLRCLFSPQWDTEGVYWALRYLHQRLLEICICDDYQETTGLRKRSESLPTLHTPSPLFPGASPTKADLSDDAGNCADKTKISPGKDPGRKESSFKKMRVAELKQSFGDRMKHRLRRRISSDQLDVGKNHTHRDETHQLIEDVHLVQLAENDEDSCGSDSSSDVSRRKSMPALRWRHRRMVVETDVEDESLTEQVEPPTGDADSNRKESITRAQSLRPPEQPRKPIITITEEGLGVNKLMPNTEWLYKKRNSMASMKSVSGVSNTAPPVSTPMKRCMTDSAIEYHTLNDDIEEASGSIFYIQQNGELNYRVILQAVHSIAMRPTSSRICAVLLNIMSCLLDLRVIASRGGKTGSDKSDGKTDLEEPIKKAASKFAAASKKAKKTPHGMAMETVVR